MAATEAAGACQSIGISSTDAETGLLVAGKAGVVSFAPLAWICFRRSTSDKPMASATAGKRRAKLSICACVMISLPSSTTTGWIWPLPLTHFRFVGLMGCFLSSCSQCPGVPSRFRPTASSSVSDKSVRLAASPCAILSTTRALAFTASVCSGFSSPARNDSIAAAAAALVSGRACTGAGPSLVPDSAGSWLVAPSTAPADAATGAGCAAGAALGVPCAGPTKADAGEEVGAGLFSAAAAMLSSDSTFLG